MSPHKPVPQALSRLDVELVPTGAFASCDRPFPEALWPEHTATPRTPEAVAQMLEACSRADVAVCPVGGGTKLALGNTPSRADVFLSTTALDRILEHDAANMTLTAQAGVPVGQVRSRVAEAGQRFPLDPPFQAHATVGGVIAANSNGIQRLRHGSVRDVVLGMKVALPNGKVIAAGGRTVKNVAGYDMCKLFIGSLGTLGVVVEATFRLLPQADASRTLVLACASADAAGAVAAAVNRSQWSPVAALWLNPVAAEWASSFAPCALPKQHLIVLCFEDIAEAVARQVREASDVSAHCVAAAQLSGAQEQRLCAELRDGPWPQEPGLVRSKVSLTPGRVAEPMYADMGRETAVVADVLSGVVHTYTRADRGLSLKALARLRAEAEAAGGSLVLEAAPLSVKEQFGVWGADPQAIAWTKRLKSAFDPGAVLNPGRFVGGI